MSPSNAKPQPKGGLTWPRQKAVVVAAAAPVVFLDIVLGSVFPDLPLSAPFGGAILMQVMLGIPFHGLHWPVERPRLMRFLAATVLTASAVMVGVAMAIRAMGWGEYGVPAGLAGIGGTMFVLYQSHKWLFTSVIERHDGPPEEQETRA